MEIASKKQKLEELNVNILMKISANHPNISCKSCAIETICTEYSDPNSGLNRNNKIESAQILFILIVYLRLIWLSHIHEMI